jgi:hypothetical protein
MPQNGFAGRGKKLPPRNLNQALYACQIPDRQGQQKRGGVEPWGGNRGPPGAGGAARGRKGSNPDVLPQARISVAMLKGTAEKFVAVGFKPESTKFVSAHASSPIPDRSGSDKSPVWAGSARPWWSSHAGTWASVLCRSGHRRQTHERSVHCRLWWGHAHASSHTSFDTPRTDRAGPKRCTGGSRNSLAHAIVPAVVGTDGSSDPHWLASIATTRRSCARSRQW